MSHYVEPQTSGVFTLYADGDFCVHVDSSSHKRCSGSELYQLLTYVEPSPVLTQTGAVSKRQPAPHKDPPGHFYVAQLHHYGLPVVKTKAAAKKKLLAAFGGGKSLEVPSHIQDIERNLQKRIEKARAAAKKPVEEENRPEQTVPKSTRTKQTARKSTGSGPRARVPNVVSAAPKAGPSDVHKAIESLTIDQLRKIVSDFVDWVPALDHAVMEAAAAGPKASKQIKKSGKPLPHNQTSGKFTVLAPYLVEEWPDYCSGALQWRMSESSTGSHLWAAFDFGIISGVVRSVSSPPTTIGETIDFMFRGRESGEGTLVLDDGNSGTLTFLGDGKIKGHMSWMGGFDFDCAPVRTPNVVWSKSVADWKRTWRSYTEDRYESESRSRWGKWVQEPRPDEPEDSDTSGGGGRDSDDEDMIDDYY